MTGSHTSPDAASRYLAAIPVLSAVEIPEVDRAAMVEIDRAMEEDLGIGLIQMMENAGRNLARLAEALLPERGGRVLVLAGRGGNGGGALTAARRLTGWGISTDIFLTSPAVRFDGVPGRQLEIVTALGRTPLATLPDVDDYALVIDGMVGYSLSGELRGEAASVARAINARRQALCLALDVPSGFDSGAARASGLMVRSDAVLTLAAPKIGLRAALTDAALYLADISVPASLMLKVTSSTFSPPADICRID